MALSSQDDDDARRRERLSALLDGQAAADEQESACTAWRDDAGARECWHAFTLIGDVMRSDELVRRGDHDRVFLQALSARLATEPMPLATPWWRRIAAPAAVAAGFAVVTGAVLVLRHTAEPDAAPALASASQPMVIAGGIQRDRRFDSYFEAHRQQSIRRAALSDGMTSRAGDATVVESR